MYDLILECVDEWKNGWRMSGFNQCIGEWMEEYIGKCEDEWISQDMFGWLYG
jgi:hypothetical protein